MKFIVDISEIDLKKNANITKDLSRNMGSLEYVAGFELETILEDAGFDSVKVYGYTK